MNHSNKDGPSLAEGGEGRTPIKENARQPNTYPTQSGKGVSQGLTGVRKAARENKEMKFTALLHHLTVDLLRESFYSLKRKAAPGVDGVTWQEYEVGLAQVRGASRRRPPHPTADPEMAQRGGDGGRQMVGHEDRQSARFGDFTRYSRMSTCTTRSISG
jgi:hypothetical protein